MNQNLVTKHFFKEYFCFFDTSSDCCKSQL